MPVAMGAGVTVDELAEAAAAAPPMDGLDLASTVSTPEVYSIETQKESKGTVVAVDLGLKRDILANLTERGFDVTVVPSGSSAEQILSHDPVGIFISNGPGDPEPLTAATEAVRKARTCLAASASYRTRCRSGIVWWWEAGGSTRRPASRSRAQSI